jgi:AAA15 family ATPase/GTPase
MNDLNLLPIIMKITIKNFKKIEEASINLSNINIFVGANNSGKSSFIQGIHFAISSCQSLELRRTGWIKNTDKRTLSLDSDDFLYTPTSDIAYLYHGKRLASARNSKDINAIKFEFQEGKFNSILTVSKGKNRGFTTSLIGQRLGAKISDLKNPFCVYVPGIAGIPILEKYEVPIAIKKSAARGDSNIYLRNILNAIHQDNKKWTQFIDSVSSIYRHTNIVVSFRQDISEYIHVDVYDMYKRIRLPLDSVGTGLLQVIQIFAYIEYFSPKIVLLDEPDAHLHPTTQRVLAQELIKRTETESDLKIVFSTHSRYILDALEGKAKVFYFQDGRVLENVKSSSILIDIGAADADYLFSKRNLKYIIATEDKVDKIDEKKEFLKKFLKANKLREDEFVLHSYEGCTKVHFANILQGFVRKQIPIAQVILHIDRDQKLDDDREILKLKEDCKKHDVALFITKFQEIESYFCQPKHLSEVLEIPLEKAQDIYSSLLKELEEDTKKKLINFILNERSELSRDNGRLDIGLAEDQATRWYEEYKNELTLGKELLGKVKKYVQENLRKDPNLVLNISSELFCDEFQKVIIPPAT